MINIQLRFVLVKLFNIISVLGCGLAEKNIARNLVTLLFFAVMPLMGLIAKPYDAGVAAYLNIVFPLLRNSFSLLFKQ